MDYTLLTHSSKIRGSSETFQNLPYFMHKKPMYSFLFCAALLFSFWMPRWYEENCKVALNEKRKKNHMGFSLEHFVEHKPLISE